MLGSNVGRWRSHTLDPVFGGYIELSIGGDQRCKLRLGGGQRMEQRGFVCQRGSGVDVELEERGTLNSCNVALTPGIRGILRAALRGKLGGRPVDTELRLIKVSSSP